MDRYSLQQTGLTSIEHIQHLLLVVVLFILRVRSHDIKFAILFHSPTFPEPLRAHIRRKQQRLMTDTIMTKVAAISVISRGPIETPPDKGSVIVRFMFGVSAKALWRWDLHTNKATKTNTVSTMEPSQLARAIHNYVNTASTAVDLFQILQFANLDNLKAFCHLQIDELKDSDFRSAYHSALPITTVLPDDNMYVLVSIN